jgi:hypothetical protein
VPSVYRLLDVAVHEPSQTPDWPTNMWVWTTTDYLETVELHPWTTYEEDTLPTGLGASISSRDDSLQLPLSQHYLYQRMGIHKMLYTGAWLIHRESTRAPYAPSMCVSSFKKNPPWYHVQRRHCRALIRPMRPSPKTPINETAENNFCTYHASYENRRRDVSADRSKGEIGERRDSSAARLSCGGRYGGS